MHAPEFKVGAELFLENFREVSLFEAQVLDNVKSRSVFEWMETTVTEQLLGVTSSAILLGQRVMLSKLTLSLSKAPTKITSVYDINNVVKCRHKEGPGGWLEIIFKNGSKLRVIMSARQTECVALISKHCGGGNVRIQEPGGAANTNTNTNKDNRQSAPALSGDATSGDSNVGGDNAAVTANRKDSEDTDGGPPTEDDIKDIMKDFD